MTENYILEKERYLDEKQQNEKVIEALEYFISSGRIKEIENKINGEEK